MAAGAAQEAAVQPGRFCLCLGDWWFAHDRRETEISRGVDLKYGNLLCYSPEIYFGIAWRLGRL